MGGVRNRSVIEILVLTMTALVAVSTVAMGGLMLLIVVREPTADISGLADALSGILTLILGALLGLLAGKTPSLEPLGRRPDEIEAPETVQ